MGSRFIERQAQPGVMMHSNLAEERGYTFLKSGKVKDIYVTPNNTLAIVDTDRISYFDAVSRQGIPHKGMSLSRLSTYWFKQTEYIVPNHFIRTIDERTMEVERAERIDIEWIVRNHIYGSAYREYEKGVRAISGAMFPDGLRLAEQLDRPILTPTTKADVGHDLPISRAEAIKRGLVTAREFDFIEDKCMRLYELYTTIANARGLIIPDFKLEFGRTNDGIKQIDEPPNHDSSRIWARRFYEVGKQQEGWAIDKEFCREFNRATGYTGEGQPPIMPDLVIEEVSKRCIASASVIIDRRSIDSFNLKSVDMILKELNIISSIGPRK